MIEGQDGLNWPRWKRISQTVEALGFTGLYRSDHYTNASPPDKDSLEMWVSLTWLAGHTRRIEFGPLVSPVSFRHPTMTARMASAVDDLSGGRLTLGLGAGWQEREHTNFGRDLLDVPRRFDRFEEGVEVVTRLLHSSEPVQFSGRYYHLQEAILLPRPQRPGGPPILIGGNGRKRTLSLAARFAKEWNAVFLSPARFADLNRRLDELLMAGGRQTEEVRRSLMTGVTFGRTEGEVNHRIARYGGRHTAKSLREAGRLVGTGPQIAEQLKQFEAAGVQRIMLQWLDLDDMDGLSALAEAVLPHFSG
jgi:F420-dependent oxidoreductase-like protein